MVQKSAIVKSDTSKMIGGPSRPVQPHIPNVPVSLAEHEEIISAGIKLADLEEYKEEEDKACDDGEDGHEFLKQEIVGLQR